MTTRPQPSSSKAYLTLSRGPNGPSLGTIRLVLRDDVVPRTVSNFKSLLVRREPGEGYRGSPFHRIVPNFMAQGGDFTRGDGTGGRSVYGETFPDENFALRHDRRGVLGMANSGPDTNGSQFFLCFRATPHLDGRHVAFGTVDLDDEESARVLDALEATKTGKGDRPIVPVTIEDCGLFEGTADEDPARAEVVEGEAAEADEDEIDLDDEGGEGAAERPDRTSSGAPASPTAGGDDDEIDLPEDGVDDDDVADDGGAPAAPKTKKEALKERLRKLKMKMNQSRQLNRREVRSEGERLGSEEGMAKERKRQSVEDRRAREREWSIANGKAAAATGGDVEVMSRQAMHSTRKAARKAAKAEANRFGANDYHNPEGQHRNYERSLRSLPPPKSSSAGRGPSSEVYDPITRPTSSSKPSSNEADGAKRLAAELKRRGEKATKRKEREQELDFEATDVSYVNKRNRKFNEKIGRMFDKHTAEIRQNLERGTAL